MAKYYDCGLSMASIEAALLDFYGAYNAVSNPDGVTIHESSSAELIFSCPAIAGKVIKFTGTGDMRAFYGDTYDGGTLDITSPVEWGGSTTGGASSAIHASLAANTAIFVTLASTLNSRVWLLGQLTNSKYAVQGLIGYNNATYYATARGKITDTGEDCMIYGLEGDYSAGGKLVKSPLVFVTPSGAQLNGSNLATLSDIYSASRKLGPGTIQKGSGYFITPSGLYNTFGVYLENSIVMEGITN